jgi:hypothetical protein
VTTPSAEMTKGCVCVYIYIYVFKLPDIVYFRAQVFIFRNFILLLLLVNKQDASVFTGMKLLGNQLQYPGFQ